MTHDPDDPQADADAIHAIGQFFDERHDAMTAAGSGTVEVSTLRETRKPQECVTCGRIILKGEVVLFQKRRPAVGCPTSHYYCDGCRESWPSERIEAPKGPSKAETRRRAAADRVNRSVRIAAELSRDLKAERDAAMVPASPPTLAPADLVRDFMAGLSKGTRATYSRSFKAFAVWAGQPDPAAACAWFLGLSPGEANRVAATFRGAMLDAGRSPSTAECRISALRSLVRASMLAGVATAPLTLPPMRSARVVKLRDTSGPPAEIVAKLFAVADVEERAILSLLAHRGLRVGEVAKLRVGDFDPAFPCLWVRGKARGGQMERVTIANVTRDAILAYREGRDNSDPDAPLFGRKRSACRISMVVREVTKRAGVSSFRPHGLRHFACTQAITAADGDLRAAAAFSRHRDVRVLAVYDDCRTDVGGELARKVADVPSA